MDRTVQNHKNKRNPSFLPVMEMGSVCHVDRQVLVFSVTLSYRLERSDGRSRGDRTRRQSDRGAVDQPCPNSSSHSALRIILMSHDIRPRSSSSRLQEELAPVLGCNPDVSWSSLILIYTARAVVFFLFRNISHLKRGLIAFNNLFYLFHMCVPVCVSYDNWT